MTETSESRDNAADANSTASGVAGINVISFRQVYRNLSASMNLASILLPFLGLLVVKLPRTPGNHRLGSRGSTLTRWKGRT